MNMNLSRAVVGGLTGALMVAGSYIAYFEGRSLVAYLDPVGIPTICEGVTRGVRMGQVATNDECDVHLELEVRRHAAEVRSAVKVPLTDNEYAAWTSFVYNVGGPAFRSSTALRKLNAGDHKGACVEMKRWVYAGGRKLNGLVKRRNAESALCLSGL